MKKVIRYLNLTKDEIDEINNFLYLDGVEYKMTLVGQYTNFYVTSIEDIDQLISELGIIVTGSHRKYFPGINGY